MPLRACVYLATDKECDDPFVQENVQAFFRSMTCVVPYRRIIESLYKAAKRSRSALVDADGNPARLIELTEADFIAIDYWLRDFIRERPPHIVRRNRPETLERRRLLITLARLAFPREASTFGKTADSLGLRFTGREPLDDDL